MKRFPFYKQLDSRDCGPTCLRMIAQWYGKTYSLSYLREMSYITKEGVSLLGICDAAEAIGLRTKGYQLNWDNLQSLPLPIIVHWNQNHFVIVFKIKCFKGKYQVFVADPANEILVYSKKDFLKYWLSTEETNEGLALVLEPTSSFYEHDDIITNHQEWSYWLNYLKPYKKYFMQLFWGILTGCIISLLFPFLTQALVDDGIGNGNLSFIIIVLIAQLFLAIGQTINDLLKNWIMLHITTRISISLISDFLIKLMKLPISFFDTKLIGDLIQRIDDHERIQDFLTGTFISMIFATITFIIYTLIMTTYHWGMFLVFIIGSALYTIWILLFIKKRRELDYLRFQESALNQSNIIQLLHGMQEIKLNGCERQKRWEWEKIQARLFKISIKEMSLEQTQQVGAFFINQIKNILISFIAAQAVIQGSMTLGIMVAIQYIIGQLNAPLEQFVIFIKSAQYSKISLERLGEIHNKNNEESIKEEKISDIPKAKSIEIKNLTFQYNGPHSPKVLENVNLIIPAGKTTAIVGASGSGKTTLIKLILGFYPPVDGNIYLNNIHLKDYSPRQWRMNCGVVMQDGYIFSDSIKNNIGIIDEKPDKNKVKQAAYIANLQDFIENLPLEYETRIGNDGHGLSNGQRQRILIARSVYKNPSYIFFDEATNSLDTTNEKIIMRKLNDFFCEKTVVVIAHRLSTVRNADQIVVMNQGRIAEIGDHKKLVEQKGIYYNLIMNQLELEQ